MIGKKQILELVLIVVGLLVVLVMVGSTTGSSGILGNVQIANNVRNGIAVIGSLFVVFVLFIFLEGIGSGKKFAFFVPMNEWTMLGSVAAVILAYFYFAYKARLSRKIEIGAL